MKEIVMTFFAIMAVSTAMVVINSEGQDTPHALGAKACTWGPSYWCQNLTTAASCHNSVKYCIPKVWSTMKVPEDNDSVCQICKDMVQQARDQLESNQTQEDLKAVFEGSCALIHIKPIVKECDTLVDQFVPELVETLASQMNPSVVCSVSGLCNSARIDKLLLEHQQSTQQLGPSIENNADECTNCFSIATHMEEKFNHHSRDHILDQFLNVCGQLSSFSDACSSIVLTNFEVIYDHLQKNFKAKNICHISGQCSDRYHVHEDKSRPTPMVEIRPLSSTGKVGVADDLPCKLCEQLVGHLRDLLVANTTEAEFQEVLEGFCKQTKSFALECKAIVDQYYPQIYSFLTQGLNGNMVCQMAGICPGRQSDIHPIAPLVPESAAKIGLQIMNEQNKPSTSAEILHLPIERLGGNILGYTSTDPAKCALCQFVIHLLKSTINDLNNKHEVELRIQQMKDTFTSSDHEEISAFLHKYDMAILELITEKKDFTEICALIAVCASKEQIEAWEKIPDTFKQTVKIMDKPNCPLCLLAVEQLYKIVKNNKTEANIMDALDKLCLKLPKNLNQQCVDFVQAYSHELLSMLLQDLSPQEVCVYLKLCSDKPEVGKLFEKVPAVPKTDLKGKETCALCEYVLHYLQQVITDPKAEDQVKQTLERVCKKLPSSILNNCNEFVDMYGDAIVAILAQEIDPGQVCPMIHLCPSEKLLQNENHSSEKSPITKDKPNCPLCLFGVTQLYNMIKDNKTEESIQNALDNLCSHLPKNLVTQCDGLVETYSKQIIEAIVADFTPQEVCVYLQLCDAPKNSEPEISFFPLDADGEIMTNEIPNFPLYKVVSNEKDLKEDTGSESSYQNSMGCEVCKQVLNYVVKVVENKKSEEEIERALHNVCNELPKHMSQKCNKFVNEYSELIIQMITDEISSEEICEKLQYCKPQATEITGSDAECTICETLVSTVANMINEDKTIEAGKIIEKVCNSLQPASLKQKCKTMIQKYAEYIINIIKTLGDTKRICSDLGFCNKPSSPNLLGKTECTYGPSYWCRNKKSAEDCKAIKYCQAKGLL